MGAGHRLITVAWRRPALLGVWLALGPALASAQPASTPASTSQPACELPPDVCSQLAEVQDFQLYYDFPAFYSLISYVRTATAADSANRPTARRVDNWRDLVERPSAFRGCRVTITGVVGANKDPYTLPRYPQLGELSQLELRKPGQPVAGTLIVTADATNVPLGATVEATGYFLVARRYLDRQQKDHVGIVLITPQVTVLAAGRGASGQPTSVWWLLGALIAGMIVTILILRRTVGGDAPRDLRTLHAAHIAPTSVADEFADWAATHDDSAGDADRTR